MTQVAFSEACERNKQPILEVLREVLPDEGQILEIGSCTGQHLVYFSSALPQLQWQPSDQQEYLDGLSARILIEGGENVLPAIELDVLGSWPGKTFEAVYSANTSHIMGWDAVCAMFAGVGRHLAPLAPFCLYGPFNRAGSFTSPSNEDFHRHLKNRDSEMGLRDVEALVSLARQHHMTLEQELPLPANNTLLVFRKKR